MAKKQGPARTTKKRSATAVGRAKPRAASPRRAATTSRTTAARTTATRTTASAASTSRTTPSRAAKAKPSPEEAPAKSSRPSPLTATAVAIGRVLGKAAATIAERVPWVGTGDAIDLLEADHRHLEQLLDSGDQTTTRAVKRRVEILKTITDELTAHEMIEEKLFYPALKSHAEAKDIVLEGYQEHHVADLLVSELHAMSPADERWGAKFKVFKENLEHHIEEEEGPMFKTARSVLSRAQLVALAAEMAEMKAKA